MILIIGQSFIRSRQNGENSPNLVTLHRCTSTKAQHTNSSIIACTLVKDKCQNCYYLRRPDDNDGLVISAVCSQLKSHGFESNFRY